MALMVVVGMLLQNLMKLMVVVEIQLDLMELMALMVVVGMFLLDLMKLLALMVVVEIQLDLME